jgi:aminoglycoside phosphotransferase (APT) family kinase protein
MTNKNGTDSLFASIGNDEEFRKRYGEQIGSGMSAVIYARDGIAAKVYREGQPKRQVFQEAFTLAVVGDLGLPAPRVYAVETFCGRTALLMDQVRGASLLDVMLKDPKKTTECLEKVVELQTAMHKVLLADFRPLRMVLKGNIIGSPGLSPEEKERLSAMLAALPDEFALCHGDFHGGNILFDGQSCTIIDWAEVSCGCPAADACRSYLDYCMAQMELEEVYLERYCAATGRAREEILAWLPVVAGAVYGYLSEQGKKIARRFF